MLSKKIRTACRQCLVGCGVIVHVQNGKVIKVEGDPESPISRGTLSSKGLSVTQLAYHPDRILHPMRKTFRGWERINWDDALDTIAARFNDVIEEHGPESIVVGQIAANTQSFPKARFPNRSCWIASPISSMRACTPRPFFIRPTATSPGCGKSDPTPSWRSIRTRPKSTGLRRGTGFTSNHRAAVPGSGPS